MILITVLILVLIVYVYIYLHFLPVYNHVDMVPQKLKIELAYDLAINST